MQYHSAKQWVYITLQTWWPPFFFYPQAFLLHYVSDMKTSPFNCLFYCLYHCKLFPSKQTCNVSFWLWNNNVLLWQHHSRHLRKWTEEIPHQYCWTTMEKNAPLQYRYCDWTFKWTYNKPRYIALLCAKLHVTLYIVPSCFRCKDTWTGRHCQDENSETKSETSVF